MIFANLSPIFFGSKLILSRKINVSLSFLNFSCQTWFIIPHTKLQNVLFEFAKSWKFRSNFRNYPRLVYMNYSQLEIFSDPVDSLQGTFEAAPVLGLGPWEPRAGSVPTPSPTRPKLWFNLLHNFCVPRTNKILKYNCTVTVCTSKRA